ncbi:MAG: hypothetical protein IPN10_12880 [Saprospiraceae bacterium]|nr:hypothetical protein [Saprospiraceae bacterium]
MTDKWIIQDIEKQIAQRKRVVIIDPKGECAYMLPLIEKHHYTILKTDISNTEEWQRVKEELMLRHEAESKYKTEKVIFYVTRPKSELSFLFDYCYTHGCVDLSNPVEWLHKKLFIATGHQITLDNPMLLTAAKLGIGRDISWWKKILQNLEELVSIEDELGPFLNNPDTFLGDKEADIKRLFEEKLFELIGQAYRSIPPKTLATEVVNHLFSRLLYNDMSPELLRIYYKWLDSTTYSKAIQSYIDKYKIDPDLNIWNVHPEHCFTAIDKQQLLQITSNFRDKVFVKEKLQKLHHRFKSRKIPNFVPDWWSDIIILFEFDNNPLALCNSIDTLTRFYTSSFYRIDRSIRNIYASFLQEENIVRPLQEHYESLNGELLQHWFDCSNQYQSTQQGYLPELLKNAKPGTAIIVGDGVRYEIAAFIASGLQEKYTITLNAMYADMPSETEHNMSALYVGNHEVLPVQKDREKRLSDTSGKNITYMNLEALYYGIKADYLILTYKDIDSTGEKLQMGAIKLFSEFEKVITEKIQLLLNMGFQQIHLVTDHGFVLTGLLDESDKIESKIAGKKDVHERFIRSTEKQNNQDWLLFERPYGEFKYVYAAKSHRPFKSKGVYGFSHGGFTPQEIIIPHLIINNSDDKNQKLEVFILNKKDLRNVVGNIFVVRLDTPGIPVNLFSGSRRLQIKLYHKNIEVSTSDIFTIHQNTLIDKEFSFGTYNQLEGVLIDADTGELIDSTSIIKSNARDLGGLI